MSYINKPIIDKRGNSEKWYCEGCTPSHDCHSDDCRFKDKALMTEKENPAFNTTIRPSYCKKCGCTYSNGCQEHRDTLDMVPLVKS